MSKQRDLAQKVFEANRNFIRDRMTAAVEAVLNCGDLDSEYAYDMVFNDGMYIPFYDAPVHGSEYDGYCLENGNSDDEDTYIAGCWVEILTEVDPIRYQTVIDKINYITENGL